MAAGLGFKTFTTGEVLTAADVNGYLMQGINVFASSAARAAAITSPQEGQYSFLKDTNSLEYYDGAAWVGAPVADITAVTAGKGLTGGGSSGDVTVSLATTAKGDLVAGSGTTTAAVLAVGANNTVLTADSTTATGLKWATPSSGSMTVLASGNLATGTTTTTFSSISASYLNLRLVIRNFNGSGNNNFTMRINNDTGANYAYYNSGYESNTTRSSGSNGQTSWNLTYGALNAGNNSNLMVFDFADYANTTTRKLVNAQSTYMDAITATAVINSTGGYAGANAAISRIDVIYGSNVNGGTYILYGVN